MQDQGPVRQRGGDPLRAMYFVAAVLMGLGSVVIVVLMFLPGDVFSRTDPDALFFPGSGPTYDGPAQPLSQEERLEQIRVDEEMHLH
jgi:hypothetical protein